MQNKALDGKADHKYLASNNRRDSLVPQQQFEAIDNQVLLGLH